MKKDVKYSNTIKKSFSSLEYTIDMLDFPEIYSKLFSAIPPQKISFEVFGVEGIIACEMICAAICHQLNWDVLRMAVFENVNRDKTVFEAKCLASISAKQIEELLHTYEKKERIRAYERAAILREIGNFMIKKELNFTELFFEEGRLKPYEVIINELLEIEVFSEDYVQKKLRLLIQNLSDYKEFTSLDKYYKPTIDYHIIRLYLRRGIVTPQNYVAKEFVSQHKIRKEQTMAALREVCSDAVRNICWITDLGIKDINRIEWWIGRSVCKNDKPDCKLCYEDAVWLKKYFDICPYYKTCHTVNGNKLYINEPDYKGKSY